MTKQESVMVQIVGASSKTELSGLQKDRAEGYNHRMKQSDDARRGIQAIRHKKTGEIIVPSMYYALSTGTTYSYWDSSDEKTYSISSYVKKGDDWIPAFIRWLRETSREALSSYELIFIEMKVGKRMPYAYGYTYLYDHKGTRRSIYHAGIAGLPRSVSNDIKEITVLQETFDVPDEEYKEQKKPHSRAPKIGFTVKEV